jgi:elongator complex protein 4
MSKQTSNSSSFVKTTQQTVINIPGCKTSLHNSQLLTSIGIPSIDSYIGGGLPVGSICLIGEDSFNYYSDIISRCFIAEGVLNRHSIYIANPFAESTNLLQVSKVFD